MGNAAAVRRKRTSNVESNAAAPAYGSVAVVGMPVASGSAFASASQPSHPPIPRRLVSNEVSIRRLSRNSSQERPRDIRSCIAAAHTEVGTILKEQAAVCQRLWETLGEALALEEALWESTMPGPASAHARVLLSAATASKDATQVSEALLHASSCNLPISYGLQMELQQMRHEEEREVLWRCLEYAIAQIDRVDIEFWCSEADNQGLIVPSQVHAALRAVREEECARLEELEHNIAMFQARVASAQELGDLAALEALVVEGRDLHMDTSSASAAVEALSGAAASANSFAPRQQPAVMHAGEKNHPGPPEPLYSQGLRSTATEQQQQRMYQPAQQFPARSAGMPNPASADAAAGGRCHPQGAGAFSQESWRAPPAQPAPPRPAFPRTWNGPDQGAGGPSMSRNGPDQGAGGPSMSRPWGAGAPMPGGGDSAAGGGARAPRPPPPSQNPPSVAATRPPVAAPAVLTRPQALACLGLAGREHDLNMDELRQAYKRAAMRWHPDRRQNHTHPEEATARFQEVRSAFDLLQRSG